MPAFAGRLNINQISVSVLVALRGEGGNNKESHSYLESILQKCGLVGPLSVKA